MVTSTALLPRMSLGYEPTCIDRASLWPCFPIMPRYGFGAVATNNPVIPRPGISGLTFDNTGLFGTGLFCWPPTFLGGDTCSWGIPEVISVLIGGFALYSMFHQTKQTKYRLEGAAQKRRQKRAAKYRAKAKRLEEKGFGGIFA